MTVLQAGVTLGSPRPPPNSKLLCSIITPLVSAVLLKDNETQIAISVLNQDAPVCLPVAEALPKHQRAICSASPRPLTSHVRVSRPLTSHVPVSWEPLRRDSGHQHPCLFLPRTLCCAEWILRVGLQLVLEGEAPWSDSEGPAPSELH